MQRRRARGSRGHHGRRRNRNRRRDDQRSARGGLLLPGGDKEDRQANRAQERILEQVRKRRGPGQRSVRPRPGRGTRRPSRGRNGRRGSGRRVPLSRRPQGNFPFGREGPRPSRHIDRFRRGGGDSPEPSFRDCQLFRGQSRAQGSDFQGGRGARNRRRRGSGEASGLRQHPFGRARSSHGGEKHQRHNGDGEKTQGHIRLIRFSRGDKLQFRVPRPSGTVRRGRIDRRS